MVREGDVWMRGKGEFLSELNGSVGQAEDNVQHFFSSHPVSYQEKQAPLN